MRKGTDTRFLVSPTSKMLNARKVLQILSNLSNKVCAREWPDILVAFSSQKRAIFNECFMLYMFFLLLFYFFLLIDTKSMPVFFYIFTEFFILIRYSLFTSFYNSFFLLLFSFFFLTFCFVFYFISIFTASIIVW